MIDSNKVLNDIQKKMCSVDDYVCKNFVWLSYFTATCRIRDYMYQHLTLM